ncbi:MAG: hypothetical protein JXA54_14970 [Candidatus Heimdallarchaeota archaeon]|nr:hypothetical protein [Candidatus Heimdallarchaeota archaeon]
MSEENEKMLREEIRAAVNEKEYHNAVSKAEQIANYFESKGNKEKARESWIEAARLFLEWSKDQRDNRTHKNSAKSLAHAADIFSNLGVDMEAAQAIDLAAQDLAMAGEEYIVWKQPLGAGVCYTVSAILFILVSQEDKANNVINQVRTRVDALRQDSIANTLIDLPIQLLYAKNQFDIRLLNNVKTMIYSSLIPAMTNSGLSEFISYIERTILGVEAFITASQKFPVLEYDLKLKGEVQVDEGFDIEVLIRNTGEDSAHQLELEMVPSKEVTIVREFSKLKANELPPGAAVAFAWRCIVKSENLLEENQKISLSGRLSFSDSKNLRQTITISPIAFTTTSTKEQDQLIMELKITKDDLQKYREKLLSVAEKNGKQIVVKLFEIIEQLLEQAKGFVDVGATQNAKNWNKLIQLQLELINDIPNQLEINDGENETKKEE